MFEINEIPKDKVKILGKEFEVDKPSVQQVLTLQRKLDGVDKAEASKTFEFMCEWISELGIDKDVLSKLKIGQLTQLIEYLSDSKKN